MMNKKHLALVLALGLLAAPLASASAQTAAGEPVQERAFEKAGAKVNLPPAKRALLQDTMKKVYEENKPLRDQMKSLHDQLHGVMTAATFDQGAFLALHEQIQKLQTTMHENRIKAMATVFAQFTPEERASMSQAIQKHVPMGGMRGGMRGGMQGGMRDGSGPNAQ